MTHEELKEVLAPIGVSQMEVARLLGVSERAPEGWKRVGVPRHVEAYVRLLVKHKNLLAVKTRLHYLSAELETARSWLSSAEETIRRTKTNIEAL